MYEASSPSGVHPLPYRYRRQGAQEENGPCHCRQLCCSQASQGAGMDRQTSAVRIPLHPDVSLLAQCRRRLLCQTHQKASQARRVPIPPRTQRRHPPLPRRHQRKPKALYLDQGPQQNHRSRQTRAPSVRFDPLEPGFLVFQYGPELIIDASSDNRVKRIDITHRDGRPAEPVQIVAPGSLRYTLTNASPVQIIAFALSISEAERTAFIETPPGFRLGGFLSGSRLLSTQTFRDLFPSETVMSAGGLAVKRLALLFTDIKGSTALYDRIGDLKAFNLVRQHFGVLRDVIAANHGALVKTIGDAVMASFHEPQSAIRAALDMLAQIRHFNDSRRRG